jgi:uncharacterized iron-regulated membrane protein
LWGDVPLEKIELKFERGFLRCKLTGSGKEQLTVDTATGVVSTRADKPKPEKPQGGGKPAKALTAGRFIKELHTGKLGGLMGKLVVDFTSLSILGLTLSGLCLWAWPKLRRWAGG